jgi:hypothetical protein
VYISCYNFFPKNIQRIRISYGLLFEIIESDQNQAFYFRPPASVFCISFSFLLFRKRYNYTRNLQKKMGLSKLTRQ